MSQVHHTTCGIPPLGYKMAIIHIKHRQDVNYEPLNKSMLQTPRPTKQKSEQNAASWEEDDVDM